VFQKLVRDPLVHFVVAALLIFGISQALHGVSAREDTIRLSRADIERLAALYAAETGAPPGPDELRSLVIDQVETLALALMRNHHLPASDERVASPASSTSSAPMTARVTNKQVGHDASHVLIPLNRVPGLIYKKGMQVRCNVCNHKTTTVCASCTLSPQHPFGRAMPPRQSTAAKLCATPA